MKGNVPKVGQQPIRAVTDLNLQIPQPQVPLPHDGASPTSPTTPRSNNKDWKHDPLGSLPKRPRAEDIKQVFDEPVQAKTFDPSKNRPGSRVSGTEDTTKNKETKEEDRNDVIEARKDEGQQGSKIAWKIRASRKRQQKHLTLGLTREEFANIQETLKNRPVECKYEQLHE